MKKLKGFRLTFFKNDEPFLSSTLKYKTFKSAEKAGLKIFIAVRNAGIPGITFTVFQYY